MRRDLIVVGTGPAGITAGMYGLRSGLETLALDKGICGGLSNELEEVKKVEFGAEEMTIITEKDSYLTKAVAISTGTKHRKLGVK
jgi:thioredoxin reductase (NADPH)